ncbi:MAG: hypothetical protein EA367_19915 [Leptolyngbya sp. DLM2.Bin15]|nr:MAG: hypothetical protein EA367_19915 [Leptolyngbya sp. DLM2.Bin15]
MEFVSKRAIALFYTRLCGTHLPQTSRHKKSLALALRSYQVPKNWVRRNDEKIVMSSVRSLSKQVCNDNYGLGFGLPRSVTKGESGRKKAIARHGNHETYLTIQILDQKG